jgi:hypothetical protein
VNGDEMIQIEAVIARTIGDPSTSVWLQEALAAAMDRDPVDAWHDAERLVELLDSRLTALLDAGK